MAPGVHPRVDVMRYLFLMGLLGLLPASHAATLESMTIERLASEATAIVRGTVGESRVGRFGALVYTLSRFEVAEVVKGVPPKDLEVALPGGSIGNLSQRFSGVPRLAAGQEYLAFLWTGPSGRTQVVGFGQGLFEIHRQGDRVEARRAPLGRRRGLESGARGGFRRPILRAGRTAGSHRRSPIAGRGLARRRFSRGRRQ